MTNKLLIGLIGCGAQSLKHIPAWKKLNVDVIIADQDQQLASKRADEFGIESVGSLNDIFNNPDVIAVDICTPTPSHFEIINRAVDAQKHFFCEKPLVSSHEEASKIREILDKSYLVGMVGYLYRFHPAFELVRDCLNDRTIGKPYFASFRLGGRGSHRVWKHKKAEGGGAVNEMMVHMLDLVLWYFGPISSISTILYDTILKQRLIQGQLTEVDGEDIAMVYLETDSGVKVVCESDLITPSYMNHIEIQATNGSIITSILDYFPSIVFCKEARGTFQTGNNIQHFPKTNLFEKQLQHFIDCISSGNGPDRNTVHESVYLLQLIDTIKRQAGNNYD